MKPQNENYWSVLNKRPVRTNVRQHTSDVELKDARGGNRAVVSDLSAASSSVGNEKVVSLGLHEGGIVKCYSSVCIRIQRGS